MVYKNSSCRAFKDEPLLSNITPTIIRDSTDAGNEEELDPELENTFGDVTYAFSSAQDPIEESSVFKTSKKFACAMVKQSNPILMLYRGNYAKEHEVDIEAVLPFAFPYGIGGLNQKRRTKISKEKIIKAYTRNKYGSGNFTRQINALGSSDFNDNDGQWDPCSDHRVNSVLKSITTSCKSLGHIAEAAVAARCSQFSMMDFFGLNSLFLTITSDDECNFRVKLYADPNKTHTIPCTGVNLIYTADNNKMNEKPPRGNGTVCKFISVKIKEDAASIRVRIYNNNKNMDCVSIEDVLWITVELADNSEEIDALKAQVEELQQKTDDAITNKDSSSTIKTLRENLKILKKELHIMHRSRQFKITPERRDVEVTVRPSRVSSIQDTFKMKMNMIPVNIATACAGHKLQGRSKDTLIVTSWPEFKNNVIFQNWEYVVLSRV
eukprot:scaffold248352_cov76-Cyclotella_meneghiniana.AAC.1